MHKTLLDPLRETWLWTPLQVVLLLALGFALTFLVRKGVRAFQTYALRVIKRDGQTQDREAEKRATTVIAVVRRPLMFVIWGLIVFAILSELGLRIEPLLAGAGIGAGIIGVAVGLGAQTLIKDVIAGIFLLLENQIRLGDVATINGTSGLVEEINLRTILLRAENGAVHIFPNGSIVTLANLTREFAQHVIELTVQFADLEKVTAVLQSVTEGMRTDPLYGPMILGPLEVMGVDKIVAAGVVLKARVKTVAQRQWAVGRELNRRLLERFDAEKIALPSAASVLKVEGGPALAGRDDLRTAVREVIEESRGERAI